MKAITERVDDIPLLIAELEKSSLSEMLNQYFPDHGNWQGIDGGKVAVIFLTYILSNRDHRLSHVEHWVSERLHTLRYSLNSPTLSSKDFTDDKLGALLDRYSDMDTWTEFEQAHNRHLINVYNLDTTSQAIRLDSMIVQSHRVAGEDFQYGYSKQHRADLPQLKTMIATLDPMAMPLHSMTVSGNTSDDVLYWPCIETLINNLPLTEQLFVGDSKMGSLETRSRIHASGHYYLMPLNKKQCNVAQLKAYVEDCPEQLVVLRTQTENAKHKVNEVLVKHRVSNLFYIQIDENMTTREVRAYLDRPARVETSTTFSLDVSLNEQAKSKQTELMGWRVYATNAPIDKLTTRLAVECYRNQYKIEHKFDELLNRITVLMPVFVQKPHRIKALICLLLLALKFVSLIQYQVRNQLAITKQKLKELYPGNPARATDMPTTNLILNAFKDINLVIVCIENNIYVDLKNLKPVQLKILELLKIPPEIYLGLNELVFSHFDFGET